MKIKVVHLSYILPNWLHKQLTRRNQPDLIFIKFYYLHVANKTLTKNITKTLCEFLTRTRVAFNKTKQSYSVIVTHIKFCPLKFKTQPTTTLGTEIYHLL